MFFGRRRRSPDSEHSEHLLGVVRAHMAAVDDATVEIVAAIAGLLGAVAYADQEVQASEWRQLEQELSRIRGLDRDGVSAVCAALETHIVDISTSQLPHYTRALRDHASRELRIEILGLLLDLAAVDGTVSVDEVNLLRRTAAALGLSQDDYNEAQRPHLGELSVLKGEGKTSPD